MKYIGGVSYEGEASGSRVERFELIDENTILLDWVSKSIDPAQPSSRFLAVAQKGTFGQFVTPWVYLLTPEGMGHPYGCARISFTIIHHDSTMIRIEGKWEDGDDETVYHFNAILHLSE
jgi:hypothetical protein